MDHIKSEILDELFSECSRNSQGVNATDFRAKNFKYLDALDELENIQYIEKVGENYYVRLIPLLDLASKNSVAQHIIYLCELVFKALHSFYQKSPGKSIKLNELAVEADIPRSDVNKALAYIVQAQILGAYTTDFYLSEESTVTPSERILRFDSFKSVVESYKAKKSEQEIPKNIEELSTSKVNLFDQSLYVHEERLAELRDLKSHRYDFVKLVRICEEMNSCMQNSNFLALGALIRMLLDHIPPIFECNSFKELASNYKAGRSLKGTLQNLEGSSRNISDGILHQSIRKKEALPTLTQVNFSQDIDVLLSEVVRKVREESV